MYPCFIDALSKCSTRFIPRTKMSEMNTNMSQAHKKLNLCLLRFWVKICLIIIQNIVTSVLFKCRRKMISKIHDIALLLHSLHHRKRFKEYNQTHCREILYDVLTFPKASKCVFSRLSKNLASFYQNNKKRIENKITFH